MTTVVLLATGGTIASQHDGRAVVAARSGRRLAMDVPAGVPAHVELQVRDLGCRGSYHLTMADLAS